MRKAPTLLVENIRTLLAVRGIEAKALAIWCGHKEPWLSKILSFDRGVQMDDLDKIADFFGLTVAQLFQPGISPLAERRHRQRRSSDDRRSGTDRRQGGHPDGALHADVQRRFRPKRPLDDSNDDGEDDGENAA